MSRFVNMFIAFGMQPYEAMSVGMVCERLVEGWATVFVWGRDEVARDVGAVLVGEWEPAMKYGIAGNEWVLREELGCGIVECRSHEPTQLDLALARLNLLITQGLHNV